MKTAAPGAEPTRAGAAAPLAAIIVAPTPAPTAAMVVPTSTTAPSAAPVAVPSDKPADTSDSATVNIFDFAVRNSGGFTSRAGLRVDVLGSRTVGLFVLPDMDAIDDAAVSASLSDSAARQATSYARVISTVMVAPADGLAAGAPRHVDQAFFAAMELPGARTLDASAQSLHWLRISVAVDHYVPGTDVYLVVTTTPVIIGSAVVAEDGSAVIDAYAPLDVFGAGAHRLRVIGDRDLGGITTDASGNVAIPSAVLDEIQTFDVQTTAIVQITGAQPDGGRRVVTRYIPLRGDLPWWLLAIVIEADLAILLVRRRGLLTNTRRRAIAVATVGTASLFASWIAWTVLWPELTIGTGLLFALGTIIVYGLPAARRRREPLLAA